jgi:acyl carrier protein
VWVEQIGGQSIFHDVKPGMNFMETTHPGLDRQAVVELILAALQDVLAGTEGEPVLPDENTRLIGRASVLDSMGLVTLIVEVEQRLEADHDLVVVLADDRAMSQTRSPFLSVGTLADYIMQLAAEQG